ncbi:hypothetical protein ACFWPA_03025 [Rhodococcus sp. NPDC058505]|uniref:hypothetical protein n=1 Tax=unclassified Rhodococcus (in: high G+C Gram-positive bacteria) TaxID=192944 RepID=UPI0036580715
MAVARATRAGSSEDDIALIKQIQPIVSGAGTIIGGLGAVLTVGAALASLS